MARYESLHGNHDDDEEQDQRRHVIHNEDEEEMDERRHTGSSASTKSSYTAVEQDDEEGGAGRRAVYAALYGGGGSPPSGGPAPASSDQHSPGTGTGADHHHQNNIHPVLQNPGPYTDAPLIPPRSPARSTSNNPFFNGPTSTTSTTSSPQQATATDHQPQRQSSRSSRSRFRSGSIAPGEPRKSRSTSRDSTNYVNQYSRSWKPSYGLPHSRDHHHHHHHHPGQSPFPPLPETAEDHHHHGEDHDYRDHDHDSSDDHHDLDQDDYMYEKESGMSTWRGRGTTGSVKEKGGKGGMRKLMLVERTDTVKRGKGAGTGTGRGRRETVMSEVSTDAADSISVRGLPINGGGGSSGWQGISTTTITAGGSGGGLNRGEQHLSYFHFESTDTLVQSKQSMLGWWLEGLGVLGGLVCIIVIGLVLSIYDHKPPPTSWPGALNLNVFLSFMTTLATACYMIPVIEGLGQLRWLRYTGGRRGNVSRPASDFEAIDQASRGVHHCWKLLGFQGGPLGLLATLITFLTLFTPCITQLVITYTPPQPHRNNPGEPFDSNRASITLVKINWSWLFFLLVQVLLSAVFLTAIIVQTRMEGIQIFKSSALPGMTALDGQARMQLGGGGLTGVGQGGNGGIMTNAALGERAKKTNLKLERSAGGGNHGYGLVQGFVVDLNSSSGSSGSTSMGSSGSGSASAGTGLHLPKGLGLGIGWERFRHRDHDALPSYEKEGGFRGGNYEEGGGGGGSVGGGRHQAFGNGPAENLNFPAAAAAAAGFTPLPTSMAMPMQIATTVPASTALPGRRRLMRLNMFGGGGGGGAGRKKLRVRGLPVHAS